jgi:hypothetical protein
MSELNSVAARSRVPVRIDFWVWGNPASREAARRFGEVGQTLCEQIQTASEGVALEGIVEHCGRVCVARLGVHDSAWVHDTELEMFAGTQDQLAHRAVAAKQARLAAYRKQFATVYLLLVTGGGVGQIAVGEWLMNSTYVHSFDCAYLLDEGGGRVFTLPNVPLRSRAGR